MSSSYNDMVDFLDAAWEARDYIVPCLIGPPGIGKTAALYEHKENVGAGNVVTIIVSQILPNEVSGITMPDADTKAMEIYDHFKLGHLKDGDILFFDELLEGDQMVMSACLTLIESRMLMSGKMLPKVQIVAACNATVQPNMLKPSIRQRFLFRKFDIDQEGTRTYLREKFGVDVGKEITSRLVSEGNEYNFLTPRSLTKMVQWIVDTPKEGRAKLANIINCIWDNTLGSDLVKKVNAGMKPSKNAQLRQAIVDSMSNLCGPYDLDIAGHIDDVSEGDGEKVARILGSDTEFENASITELMEILTKLPEWDMIQKDLSNTNFVEDNEDEELDEIQF